MVFDYMALTPIGGFTAIIFAVIQYLRIKKKSPGNEEMQRIQRAIRIGAKAYLYRQYLGVYISALAIISALIVLAAFGLLEWFVPYAFFHGLTTCALAGAIGMMASTYANARTAEGCKKSVNEGLKIAFAAGSIMGLGVVGIVLTDISIWYWGIKLIYNNILHQSLTIQQITDILVTSAIGTSYMAFFARVGGGVYTKGADVGADLTGKIEENIPEDDPRNPAVIADQVGDNVGDVAGMGADLHESYASSILAAMSLGAAAFAKLYENAGRSTAQLWGLKAAGVPPLIMVTGVVSSIIGIIIVRIKKEKTETKDLMRALNRGLYVSASLTTLCAFLLIWLILGWANIRLFFGFVLGLFSGLIIGWVSEYFTSDSYKPTLGVVEASKWGVAPVIIRGLSVGMGSVGIPILAVSLSSLGAYLIGANGFGDNSNPAMGLFAISLTAVGMLSILGISLSTDAYGPVSDNAAGISTMANLDHVVRERADALDTIGNTTAAIGKGFVIGSGALTVLAMISAYIDIIKSRIDEFGLSHNLLNIQLSDPRVIAGLFIGGMMPFIFSALTSNAVSKAAEKVVAEVRRQFKQIIGLREGKAEPDYANIVKIAVTAGQKSMIWPGILTVLVPVVTGLMLGPWGALALLVGSLVSGFSVALFFSNAGATWDNAKKHVEAENLKGTDQHKALVIGDTVGDPLKDTSGPSLDGLIKLMTTTSIVIIAFVLKANIYNFI